MSHPVSESSNKGLWLLFAGGIIAALLTFLGVKYKADTDIAIASMPISATQTAEARLTLIASRNTITTTNVIISSPTPAPATAVATVAPTLIPSTVPSAPTNTSSPSPVVDVSTPPASIANPFCPRPLNLEFKYPSNGSIVSGVVQIRGTVKPRNVGQWYSLFYRAGIVREEMDTLIQNRVPRDRTTPVGGNIPIEFYSFTNVPVITDGILGTWDTTTMPAGWYSLRIWLREIDSQFLACDIYLAVRK